MTSIPGVVDALIQALPGAAITRAAADDHAQPSATLALRAARLVTFDPESLRDDDSDEERAVS